MAPDSAAALRQLPQQQSARGGNTRCGDNPLTIGPFAKAWPELQPLGLALIPLGGIDGKVTIPSWRKWTSPPGPKALRRFASQFPASNIGALPGLSRPPLLLKGTWADLASLPEVLPGSLPIVERPAEVITLRAVRHGIRNSRLQKDLLREVKHCDDFKTLLDVARTIVAEQFECLTSAPRGQIEGFS
jgi:hypothetical protein